MDKKPCVFEKDCVFSGPGCGLKDLIDYCNPLFINPLLFKDVLQKLKKAGLSPEEIKKIIFRIL